MSNVEALNSVLTLMSLNEWNVIHMTLVAWETNDIGEEDAVSIIKNVLTRRKLWHPFFINNPIFLQAFTQPFDLIQKRCRVPDHVPPQFVIPDQFVIPLNEVPSLCLEEVIEIYEYATKN